MLLFPSFDQLFSSVHARDYSDVYVNMALSDEQLEQVKGIVASTIKDAFVKDPPLEGMFGNSPAWHSLDGH